MTAEPIATRLRHASATAEVVRSVRVPVIRWMTELMGDQT